MSQKTERRTPLEEGLIVAMQSIDKQVLREISTRGPGEKEEHGIQKWEPFDKRIELISGFILNELGEESIGLDSLLVLSQAFSKALQLVVEDLGEEGLGDIRSNYARRALESIEKNVTRAQRSMGGTALLS